MNILARIISFFGIISFVFSINALEPAQSPATGAVPVVPLTGSMEIRTNPSSGWQPVDLTFGMDEAQRSIIKATARNQGDPSAKVLGLIISTQNDSSYNLIDAHQNQFLDTYKIFLENYSFRVFPLQKFIARQAMITRFQKIEDLSQVMPQITLAYLTLPALSDSVTLASQTSLLAGTVNELQKELAGKDKVESVKIVTIAYGENTNVVNRVSRAIAFDSLIHLQSPIYEWSASQAAKAVARLKVAAVAWGLPVESAASVYTQALEATPSNFRRLYNFYGKEALVSERKYRQQRGLIKQAGSTVYFDMPVKNIYAIKRNEDNQLDGCSTQDLLSIQFARNLSRVIDEIEQYELNYDLIGQVIDEFKHRPIVAFEEEEVPQEVPQNGAQQIAIAVNRFLFLDNDTLMLRYGEGYGQEYVVPVYASRVAGASLFKITKDLTIPIKNIFTNEFNRSEANVFDLLALIGSTVQSDLNRLIARYQDYKSLPELQSLLNKSRITLPASIEGGLDKLESQLKHEFGDDFVLNRDYAREQIYLGALYAHQLYTNTLALGLTNNQTSYLRSIIALMWFLYAGALAKNPTQAFVEGSFILVDPEFKLYEYLLSYIKKFNPQVSGDVKRDSELKVSTNPFGYPRASTHFKKHQDLFRQYGIDMRYGMSGELPLLPALKRHILFGKINERDKLIFLKFENYGLYIYDGLPMHGYELGQAQLRKFGVGKKSDDDPDYRKERVPKSFITQFQAMINESSLDEASRAQWISQAKEVGIKILFDPDLASIPGLDALKSKFAAPEYDYPQLRTGREVIVMLADIGKLIQDIRPDVVPESRASAASAAAAAAAAGV